ncbi:MAG TPA: PAS domain S-box protein [Herpetosiphonaceae bacterium]
MSTEPPLSLEPEVSALRQRVAELEQQLQERAAAEATLRDSERCYRQMFERNRTIKLMIDPQDGTIIDANPAACRFYGYSLEQIRQMKISQINMLPPEEVAAEMARAESEQRNYFLFPHRLASGEIRQVEVQSGPVELGAQRFLYSVIHDITDRVRAEAERAQLQDQIIQVQSAMLAELSTPLIPISDQVVVLPLIGTIDAQRAQQVIEALLHGIEAHRAEVAIIDITGVSDVDTHVANTLMQAARAVRLLGAQIVLTGIRPEVAQTLVGLGLNLNGLVTLSTLQSGIAFAVRR